MSFEDFGKQMLLAMYPAIKSLALAFKESGEQMEIIIDSDTWTKLKEVADDENLPISVLATIAIKEYLEGVE